MILRPSGIIVDAPEGVSIVDAGGGVERGGGPIRVVGPVGGGGDVDESLDAALVAAMQDQQLGLVDQMVLDVGGEARRDAGPIKIDVPLGTDEAAVILVEQDGFYRWVFPETEAASDELRAPGTPPGAAFFVHPEPREPEGADRTSLGEALGISWVRTFVFRFVARAIVHGAVRLIDERVDTGLVSIWGVDPRTWNGFAAASLSARDRAPRILLLVHGTFSSTIGCFGALGATPWGRAFLEASQAHYDLVFGYDHKSLTENPLANAEAIAKAIEAIAWPAPPEIDVVCHSRGGLIVRALMEKVLPHSRQGLQLKRAIFVGAANNGTELARPANWHRFIDLYTSLAVATCRALALLPHAAPAAEITRGIVKTVGSLVRGIVDQGLEGAMAPGLAAMTPGGRFLQDLDESQQGASTKCFMIAADFEPKLGGDHQPKELPLRLLLWAADNVVDGLMEKVANDLVVDTRSMEWLGSKLQAGWSDALRLGKSPNVYHTNYFARPEVVNLLVRWLSLPAPARSLSEVTFFTRELFGTGGQIGIGGSFGPKSERVRPLVVPYRAAPPGSVDVDIFVASEAMPAETLLHAIETNAPSYVVLRRPHRSKVLNYAYAPEEIAGQLSEFGSAGRSVGEALDLHESDSARFVTIDKAGRWAPSTDRVVVIDGGIPVGVLPGREELLCNYDTAELVGRVANATDATLCRRAMPSFNVSDPTEAGAPPPHTTTLNFGAEMPAETAPGETALLEVEISREVLSAPAEGTVSTRATAKEIVEEQDLEVEVLARRGFALEDDALQTIAVPPPDAPVRLRFKLIAAREGPGSVWVIIRQDGTPCARLALEPRIAAGGGSANRARAEATGVTGGASAPELTLEINEVTTGNERRFVFRLRSDKLNLLLRSESPSLRVNAQQHVDAIYREIEQSWTGTQGQAEAFDRKLRSVGGRLWNELIRADLQKMLWENRDRLTSIQVLSEEPFIPWEILCVVEPGGIVQSDTRYFAEFGLVRWLWEASKPPPTELRIAPGRSWYIIPSYPTVPKMRLRPLPEAEAEAQFLKSSLHAHPVVPLPADVAALLAGPDQIDFLHFAGHGFAASGTTANPQIMLDLERLSSGDYVPNYLTDTEVRSGSDFGLSRPMIMLNACQAGRAQWSLTGMGGFAEAFLMRGAGMFVGTLWSVGDAPARTFSEALYRSLIVGETLSKGTRAAREESRASGDPSWLAYAVYGHPDAKLSIRE